MLKSKPAPKLRNASYDAYLVFHHQHVTGISYAYKNREGIWVKEVGYSDQRKGLAMLEGATDLLLSVKENTDLVGLTICCSDVYLMKLWAGYLKEDYLNETRKLREWREHFEFISFPKPDPTDSLYQELKKMAQEFVN